MNMFANRLVGDQQDLGNLLRRPTFVGEQDRLNPISDTPITFLFMLSCGRS